MKKINIVLPIILILMCGSCAGYKPIFKVSNLNFEIMDYSLQGEKEIAKIIYYKLNNISKSQKNSFEKRKINFTIEVEKNKTAISKDQSGQPLEYKMNIRAKILAIDFLTNNEILKYESSKSVAYAVQEQYSNTLKFENNSINNLVDSIYEEILIQLTDAIVSK